MIIRCLKKVKNFTIKVCLRVILEVRILLKLEIKEITDKYLYLLLKKKVVYGPFKGLKYIESSCGSAYAAKILGTYEKELHHCIEDILADEYDSVIDVGCAEGYYAVGLAVFAKKNPIIHAYDIDPVARAAITALSNMNNVNGKIEVYEFCSPEEVRRVVKGRTLVICDIEGGETEFLDPVVSPELTKCDILVECHDGIKSTLIRDCLYSRFTDTHTIDEILFKERKEEDFPVLSYINIVDEEKIRLMQEWRCLGLRWLFMRSKNNAV